MKYKIASRILQYAVEFNIETVEYLDESHLGEIINSLRQSRQSKEVIILKEFHGRKFQKCPGSTGVICCNYYLLNTCFNCLYDCTYCFLNSYLNSFGVTQFVNLDDLAYLMLEHSRSAGKIVRIGTGEFTDSLMFDEITGIAEDLINRVADEKNIFLEFKTKSNSVKHLSDISNKGNTVIAWTLNTPRNIKLYESGTAGINERIDAACFAQRKGYLTAFHFDPVIEYDGFFSDYEKVIKTLSESIDPFKVVWISIGCFRYSPGFKDIIKHKYPAERLTVSEMFPGVDGKFRYLKKRRIEIYRFFYNKLRVLFPLSYIYFCMEDADVWSSVTGLEFKSSSDLEQSIAELLEKNFL